jgi:hypothetical protein
MIGATLRHMHVSQAHKNHSHLEKAGRFVEVEDISEERWRVERASAVRR